MAAVVDLTSGTQEEDGNGVVEIITAENSEHPSAVALGNDAAVPNRLDKRPYDAQVLVVEDDPSDQSPSSVTRYRRNRRRARAPSDTEVVCVAGPTSSPGEVVFVSAEPRKTSSKSLLSCHLCGDSHPEECTVSCSKGRRRQRHTLCCDCLENYVSSQAENMGQAFAQHRQGQRNPSLSISPPLSLAARAPGRVPRKTTCTHHPTSQILHRLPSPPGETPSP